MKASQKKGATMSIASSVLAGAIMAFTKGNYYAGGGMMVAVAALFFLYEFYQVEQIKGTDAEMVSSAGVALGKIAQKIIGKARRS